MKTISILILATLLVSPLLYAQENSGQTNTIKSAVTIKSTVIPFLFETGVAGKLNLTQQSLSSTPNPCNESDKRFSSIFPCNNHLINPINLNFGDIERIKRRSYLFIIPNKIFVRKKSGETYLFATFKRKKIIYAFNKFKLENSTVGLK
jgi:hypothetical protein